MNPAFKQEVMACMKQFAAAVHADFDYDDAQLDRLKRLLTDAWVDLDALVSDCLQPPRG